MRLLCLINCRGETFMETIECNILWYFDNEEGWTQLNSALLSNLCQVCCSQTKCTPSQINCYNKCQLFAETIFVENVIVYINHSLGNLCGNKRFRCTTCDLWLCTWRRRRECGRNRDNRSQKLNSWEWKLQFFPEKEFSLFNVFLTVTYLDWSLTRLTFENSWLN